MIGRHLLAATLLASGLPATAWGQMPEGSEFQVNTSTSSPQVNPAISADANGFIIAWAGVSASTQSFDVFARRFASNGSPLGGEFMINAWTTGYQALPSVAHVANGGFVVVWQSVGEDGSAEGIAGRRFNSSGQAQGQDFVVNEFTPGIQRNASLACGPDGSCVVVWESVGQDGSEDGVFARRYASNGALGSEFQVNAFTSLAQNEPAVSRAPDGGFLVTWQSVNQGGFVSGVFARRYDSHGLGLASEFHVGGSASVFQRFPGAAHDTDEGFVVVWQEAYIDGSGFGIAGQSFDSLGRSIGSQFLVNAFTTGVQLIPAVALQSAGRFVVAWASNEQDGSNFGVFARGVNRKSRVLGPEFRVNETTLGYQASPAISTGADGQFVVAWIGQDGGDRGILARRYAVAPTVPSAAGVAWVILACGLVFSAGAEIARRTRRHAHLDQMW